MTYWGNSSQTATMLKIIQKKLNLFFISVLSRCNVSINELRGRIEGQSILVG